MLGLGEAHFANKKFQKAYYFHNKALEIGVAAENRRIIWKAHYELGQTCLNLEKMKFFQEALKHFHKCYTIASSDEEMSLTEGYLLSFYPFYFAENRHFRNDNHHYVVHLRSQRTY